MYIDVIKMDIEGAELKVLEHGAKILASNDLIIILELHNEILRFNNIDPATVVQLLKNFGMETSQITESGLAKLDGTFFEQVNPHLLAASGSKILDVKHMVLT